MWFLKIEWESAGRVHKVSCLSKRRVSVDLHTGCADEITFARKKLVTLSIWGVPFVNATCQSTFVTKFGTQLYLADHGCFKVVKT